MVRVAIRIPFFVTEIFHCSVFVFVGDQFHNMSVRHSILVVILNEKQLSSAFFVVTNPSRPSSSRVIPTSFGVSCVSVDIW